MTDWDFRDTKLILPAYRCDTGARVKETNQYFTVLCSDYFSCFFINPKKDRLTVLEILSQKELSFLINPYAPGFLEERRLKAEILTSSPTIQRLVCDDAKRILF